MIYRGIPEGWSQRLYEIGDLNASSEELRGSVTWFSRSLQGMLRSLQGRLREASLAFQAAELERKESPPLPGDRLRSAVHRILKVENKIVRGFVPSIETRSTDEMFEPFAEADDETSKILAQRIALEASIQLYHGKFLAAAEIYTRLISKPVVGNDMSRSLWHIGLATCQVNVGAVVAAMRSLDNAGLHVQKDGRRLNVARSAARLATVYRHLGRSEENMLWDSCMRDSGCPPATIDALERRGRLLLHRSRIRGHLVML
jgi:hypothetical protein